MTACFVPYFRSGHALALDDQQLSIFIYSRVVVFYLRFSISPVAATMRYWKPSPSILFTFPIRSMEDSSRSALCAESIMAFKSLATASANYRWFWPGQSCARSRRCRYGLGRAENRVRPLRLTVYDSDHNGICMSAIQNGCFTGTNEKTTYSAMANMLTQAQMISPLPAIFDFQPEQMQKAR